MLGRVCVVQWMLVWVAAASLAGEGAPLATTLVSPGDETNVQQVARALWQLQWQLRSNQIALEQNAQEAREVAARNAEALARGLQQIESAFSAQQQALAARNTQELQAIQRSNRVTLILGGALGMLACLALGAMSWFQWRISRAWTGISALWPGPQGTLPGPVQDSNRRLLGAMERLEKRLQQLEHSVAPALKEPSRPLVKEGNGESSSTEPGGPRAEDSAPTAGPSHSRIQTLLGEGKMKLQENDPESALRCFDEVLELAPNHGEALVKKGAALERLQKLNEACECYDRAIAADESMTIAYLHKGGLCNRLERFKEALECYEKALRTQERHG